MANPITWKRSLSYCITWWMQCTPCWPVSWFRKKLLKNSAGFWPDDGKGKIFCSICRSGIGANGGLCILILGLLPLKGWPEETGGCIGNPCGVCCPGGLCGMGGPVKWPMEPGDPGGGPEGAGRPVSSIAPLCISSEPPLNWLAPSPWFCGKLVPLKNKAERVKYCRV